MKKKKEIKKQYSCKEKRDSSHFKAEGGDLVPMNGGSIRSCTPSRWSVRVCFGESLGYCTGKTGHVPSVLCGWAQAMLVLAQSGLFPALVWPTQALLQVSTFLVGVSTCLLKH